jgi:hypothetical protein
MSAPALYDRMERQQGWNVDRLRTGLTLVLGGQGAVPRYLSLAATCIGAERVFVVSPDLGGALDACDAAMLHNPLCYADARGVNSPVPEEDGRDVICVLDAGDPELDAFEPPAGAAVLGYARVPEGIAFGTDLAAVREGRTGRPPESRAEVSILGGELLTGVCALADAYRGPAPFGSLGRPAGRAVLPLSGLPRKVSGRCRLYTGGIGGAISHLFFAAAAMDPVLSAVFDAPGSRIVGADRDHIEPSNRARQCGYRTDEGRKAPETAAWLRGLFPGASVIGIDDRVARDQFEAYGPFDAVLSSVDTWASRLVLANLSKDAGVPIWLSAGSSFFGGFGRVVTPRTACPFVHGVEALLDREDDGTVPSCGRAPAPSSLLPQAIVAGWLAAALRELLLGRDVDPRGVETNLLRTTTVPGFEGLRFGRGHELNETCPCPGLGGTL